MSYVLLAVALLDELASGVSSVASPEIERTFAMSHATLAALLFVGPGVVSLVLEPIVFLLADRHPRAWFVRGGLTVMAGTALAAAFAPGPIALAIVLAISWVATGAGVSLAQATLLDAAPAERARTMARWTFASLIGDLAAPALLMLLGATGVSLGGAHWRATYVVVAALLAAWAVVTWVTPIPRGVGTVDEDVAAQTAAAQPAPEPRGLIAGLREALRDRVLLAWLFGLQLCDLLDEILIVFAALHVREVLHGSPAAQAAVVGASMLGGAAGLVALDRLLARGRAEADLLVASGLACATAFAAWLFAPTVWLSAALMFVVGATASPLYPLVAAQAYARRPAASGSVLAAGHLFGPLGLALPYLIGVVADHAGTRVALALLIVEPLGLVALTVALRRRAPPRSSG